MKSSTAQLVLAPDAAIDLQVHTHYSDGVWTPEQLMDHLVGEMQNSNSKCLTRPPF
jgi:hypothetical protein